MKSREKFSRIVVKVGSSLISVRDNRIDFTYLKSIVTQVNALFEDNREVILVSSGAVACGMSLLGLSSRPRDIASLQAVAAIGQNELMGIYRKLLKYKKRLCGQLLLTWEDFEDRKRYLNVGQTLLNLLKNKALPIINENDTVATEEIRFGDNDKLSSLVATLAGAELLLILSDVEGLYRLPGKQVIKVVEKITPEINRLCCNTDKEACVGGMSSKIEAVKIATNSGIPSIIANGKVPDVILKAVGGQAIGTLFLAKGVRLKARERWIAYGVRPQGIIIVDDGAKKALLEGGKSLLSVGIAGIEGDFKPNETVSILDRHQDEFARGRVNFSARELKAHQGMRLKGEVVHRDNLVILI